MTRTIQCVKLGHEAEGLAKPPLPGPLGQKIFEHVSQEAWNMWLRTQTMIINEYRLNLSDAESRKLLQEEMKTFFFGKA